MTNKITPERARDLLNMAHQGAQDGQRPVTVAAKYAPLAEAAYALAQTVAGLRYEYAVQVLLSDGAGGYTWHFADEDSLPFGSLKPYEVRWYTKKEAQEILDAEVDCFGPKDIRIVRRLAGESEVVE